MIGAAKGVDANQAENGGAAEQDRLQARLDPEHVRCALGRKVRVGRAEVVVEDGMRSGVP